MLGDWLTEELNRRGWSHSELARRAGLSQVSVSGVIAGSRPATCDFCIKIATALGETPEHVLRLAGILPPLQDGDDPALTEAIELLHQLSPNKHQDALKYLRFLSQADD